MDIVQYSVTDSSYTTVKSAIIDWIQSYPRWILVAAVLRMLTLWALYKKIKYKDNIVIYAYTDIASCIRNYNSYVNGTVCIPCHYNLLGMYRLLHQATYFRSSFITSWGTSFVYLTASSSSRYAARPVSSFITAWFLLAMDKTSFRESNEVKWWLIGCRWITLSCRPKTWWCKC